MLKLLDNLSVMALLALAILLGMAPMQPEPHLVEKLRMLFQGNLSKPIDIFDLFLHSSGIILVVLKLWRMAWLSQHKKNNNSES